MLNKTLEQLEFNKILDILSNYCVTYIGKQKALNLKPYNSSEVIQSSLNQTSVAIELLSENGNPPIEDFANIEIYIKNLESGNTLSAKALLNIANVLKISNNLHGYFYSNVDISKFSILNDYFNKLYSNKKIESTIFNSIIDENTISDEASNTLFHLRKNRKKLEEDIHTKLSSFCRSSTYSKYLMDNIVTIKNNRFVIPVKDEFKDKISGSILSLSASGSTVYIEPSIIYELNNKINSIKAEEELEIEKILKSISCMLMPITENLKTDIYTIGLIDFIFAKAKFSKKIDGINPKINNTKSISLISARHPLIDSNKVVPIDIFIGEKYTSLLITGPNTGGKTATLKTVGLLILMAKSGMHIPAKENSSIYIFDNIFADIGDEQSIQESLSTFSSHMLNIIDIIKKASSDSLILLDELGSGTDPIEGSSLAISILEYFHNLGTLTIATTHYHELKNYALVTDGFENASSDFDVEHLVPTYKLIIGVPGKSNAFAISKNLGLSEDIIKKAKTYLKQDTINIETLLKQIYDDKLKIEKEKENISKNSNQIELLRKSLERNNEKLNMEAENIISNAKIKATQILLDAKEEANEIIRDLDKNNISTKEANLLRNKLNENLNNLQVKNNIKTNANLSPCDLKIGLVVFVKRFNQNGILLSLPNKSNQVLVQIGIMKTNLDLSEICLANNNKKTNENIGKVNFSNTIKSSTILPEINVIGLNVDQALPIIDKYLDDAYLSGLKTVRIVHGKGTGKLKSGIHNFLKSHPQVKDFRIGSFGEGEMGVTVVNIK